MKNEGEWDGLNVWFGRENIALHLNDDGFSSALGLVLSSLPLFFFFL